MRDPLTPMGNQPYKEPEMKDYDVTIIVVRGSDSAQIKHTVKATCEELATEAVARLYNLRNYFDECDTGTITAVLLSKEVKPV